MRENADQDHSKYEHFSRSVSYSLTFYYPTNLQKKAIMSLEFYLDVMYMKFDGKWKLKIYYWIFHKENPPKNVFSWSENIEIFVIKVSKL